MGGVANRNIEDWFERLRMRFVALARERVPDPDVEDIVQEALGVVHAKRLSVTENLVEGLPPLFWCYKVLRFTVNNYYRKTGTRRKFFVTVDDDDRAPETVHSSTGLSPFESLESQEATNAIRAALEELQHSSDQCGRYLTRVVQGLTARVIANKEGLEEAVFYRRLYRCRQKLRELLAKRGIDI